MIFKYRYCLKLQYANNDIYKQQTLTNGKIQNFRSLIVVVYNSITIERERGGGGGGGLSEVYNKLLPLFY